MTEDYEDDHPEYDYEEPLPKGVYCSECGCLCDVVLVDFGIGPYEYWGQKGVDVNKQAVTQCCESDKWFEAPHKLIEYYQNLIEESSKMEMATRRKLLHADNFIKRLFVLSRKLIREAYENGKKDQFAAEHTMGGGG